MKLTSIPRIKRVSLDRPRLRQFGYHVENPADQGLIDGFEWADYLRLDLTKLITCQAIALLPGWDKSKGARPEYACPLVPAGVRRNRWCLPVYVPDASPS